MRTTANTNRLRATALLLLALGVCAPFLGVTLAVPLVLLLAGNVLGLLLLTIGLAFWSLSRDQNAGILVDGKGLLLNLGGSSSFIAWDTIERAGMSGGRPGTWVAVETSRLYVYKAAWLKDQGKPNQFETSLAKYAASEAAVHAANECMKIYGSYGFSTEYPAERFYRDAKSLQVVEGTSNIQKVIISGMALGFTPNRE